MIDCCPTITSAAGTSGNNQPIVTVPMVLDPIGADFYNQVITGRVTMTLTSAKSDPHHLPCALIPYTLKIRSGCEGGGKGALVQKDKSATLSGNNARPFSVPTKTGGGEVIILPGRLPLTGWVPFKGSRKIGVHWFFIRTLRSTRCGETAWLSLVCSTSWRVFKKSLPKGIWIISLEVIPLNLEPFIFDCEVFAYDWLFVFKNKVTGEYTEIWNDNEAVEQFMTQEPLLAGFNNKHYDQFILKAVLSGFTPEEIKAVNDFIIVGGHEGWEYAPLRDCGIFFDQYDLMDDCQMGLSLKAIEAHLGMDIRETTVPFNIDRPLTEDEKREVEFYCRHDVDATDRLDDLRQGYLSSKLTLGREKGLYPAKALYMTNAKLTAAYLDAEQKPHYDEREYQYPPKLLRQYIPQEVFDFFERLKDKSIPDEVVFKEKLDLMVGGCPCTIAYGGIHGAIPCYREEATETRSIRNKDVASYYPHQMTLNGYCSRNIPSPDVYAATIERRVKAKRAGDKATANALKLVLNTTYGAMLNRYNDLYDPLMGRSVCISGQLQLLEMAEHLVQDCPTLKIIQLNTDGIMVSLDDCDVPMYQEITQEWQDRTGFELEEDLIKMICQKDVNNYVEVPFEGDPKIKGGVLVRGIAPAGAFNINNNACVVAKAVKDYLAYGIPVEDTIMSCDRLLDFQLVAKAGSKYGDALHEVDGQMEVVQKVNRVYATEDHRCGTLYKIHLGTGNPVKIAGLPAKCVVDNDNHLTIDVVDRDWYIRLARRYVRDFLGEKPPKRNTRRVNSIKKKLLEMLEVQM